MDDKERGHVAAQGVSRRTFLKAAGLAGIGGLVLGGGVLGLRGCRGTPPALAGKQTGPYAVWREVQAALRASPDHTLARAKALVEAGDVAAIHRFVRDEIRLVPADGTRFVLGNGIRWGPRAALRAGAGTAREKAEILADLIRQTGREAEVVETDPAAASEGAALFFRDSEPAFDPPVTPAVLQDWRTRLGQRPQEARAVDSGAREAEIASVARRLQSLKQEAGGSFARRSFDPRLRGRLPIVRFKDAALGVRHADPVTPGAELASATGRVFTATGASGLLPVSIALSYTTADAPDSPVELVRAQWTAEEVAGRQVRIGFRPLCDLQALAAARIGDVRAFTPVLAIQALDGAALDPGRSVVLGRNVTLEGDHIALADGGVSVNGEYIGDGAPSAAAGRVVSVEVEADATHYPGMRLLLRPRDAQGRIVDALGFADFALSEQGERVGHLLKRRDRAPRILFLADASLSMPVEFRGVESASMAALVARVETAARAIDPDARIAVQTTDSNLWEHLFKTLGADVDLVVYATDGDVAGKIPNAEERRPLGAGPRVMVMNVHGDTGRRRGPGRSNPFDEIAQATRGAVLDVVDGDVGAVDEAIARFLDQQAAELPYVLAYRAPAGAAGQRTVEARIGAASGQAAYEAIEGRASGRSLASLRFSVRVGDREVTRVLAGHGGTGEVTREHRDAVHGAMLGTHLLALEGPPPSLSTVLDDVLAARLSIEPIDRAAAGDTGLPRLLQLLEQGFQLLPGELATLMMRTGPLSGPDHAFAEQGMRCVLHSVHPVINSDRVVERVDILPLANVAVIAREEAMALDKSLQASLRLASAEAAMFSESTFGLLAGKALSRFDTGLYASNQVTPGQRAGWEAFRRGVRRAFPGRGVELLCATDLSTTACWAMDRDTLEVHALLPDMSGGGQRARHIERQLAELDRVISMYNMLPLVAGAAGVINPIGGVALAIVAAYGQNLARLYAAASMAIILMDASGIEPALRKAIASMACNIVKAIFLGVFAAASKVAEEAVNIFVAADNLIGTTGVSNPFSCPT